MDSEFTGGVAIIFSQSDMPNLKKAVRREEQVLKEKYSPKGGTRAGQAAHMKTARGYAGLSRVLKKHRHT